MAAPFLRSLRVQNLLSFNEEGVEIEFGGLTVLIGPNGSGKSNLLDALRVLKATPSNYAAPFAIGGVGEWVHKGGGENLIMRISADLKPLDEEPTLSHSIEFRNVAGVPKLIEECIKVKRTVNVREDNDELILYFSDSVYTPRIRENVLRLRRPDTEPRSAYDLYKDDLISKLKGTTSQNIATWDFAKSVLAQRRDAQRYKEMTHLALSYEQAAIFSDWSFGRRAPLRQPVSPDVDSSLLSEDSSNLASVLGSMINTPAYIEMREMLASLNERYTDLYVVPAGGAFQIMVRESGFDTGVPAARLSDGTLRLFQLMAIFLNRRPRSLVVLEEPELGLHPDAIRAVARMIVSAKERMQIILTTHSPLLLTALQDEVDRVVVCERDRHGSRMESLRRGEFEGYLTKFELGELWTSGEIGGVLR